MTPEELKRRLDGRTGGWLGRYLGISRANISLWLRGEQTIPEKYHVRIRERLPLADESRDELFFRTGYMTAVKNMREAVSAVASLVDDDR